VYSEARSRARHAEDQKQAKEHGIRADRSRGRESLFRLRPRRRARYITAEELIENIDIGGPTMLRSAGKKF